MAKYTVVALEGNVIEISTTENNQTDYKRYNSTEVSFEKNQDTIKVSVPGADFYMFWSDVIVPSSLNSEDLYNKLLKVLAGENPDVPSGGSWDYALDTEVDTGQKWIDGSAIYSKTTNFTAVAPAADFTQSIPFLSGGDLFGDVIDIRASFQYNLGPTQGRYFLPYYIDSGGANVYALIDKGGTQNLNLRGKNPNLFPDGGLDGKNILLTVFYTKQ